MMILTELERITLFGICAGFFSGIVQSNLDYYLTIKWDRQSIDLKKAALKCLFSACSLGIIIGAMSFVYTTWEYTSSESEINRFTVIMATFYGFSPLVDRLSSWIFVHVKSFLRGFQSSR